jgi:hypothetical protein
MPDASKDTSVQYIFKYLEYLPDAEVRTSIQVYTSSTVGPRTLHHTNSDEELRLDY